MGTVPTVDPPMHLLTVQLAFSVELSVDCSACHRNEALIGRQCFTRARNGK
jgi:hypothetical protein